MDKYHTLFLSDNGSVYSCGFGVGGRLGHDNEEPVLVLIPMMIEILQLHFFRSVRFRNKFSLLKPSKKQNKIAASTSLWRVIVPIFSLRSRCWRGSEVRDCSSSMILFRGALWSCGLNNYQQLGHPGVTKVLVPTKVIFRATIQDTSITNEKRSSRYNSDRSKSERSLILRVVVFTLLCWLTMVNCTPLDWTLDTSVIRRATNRTFNNHF